MEAGCELDAKVALAMGWKPPEHEDTGRANKQHPWAEYDQGCYLWLSPEGKLRPLPAFSTDWAAAGMMFERLMEKGIQLEVETYNTIPHRTIWVIINQPIDKTDVRAVGYTLPHALALAVVHAHEEGVLC